MLARRLRRRPNIEPSLVYWLVFAGLYTYTASRDLPCRPLRGRGLMYLLYPKNSTWR